jgi:hypothetical protein
MFSKTLGHQVWTQHRVVQVQIPLLFPPAGSSITVSAKSTRHACQTHIQSTEYERITSDGIGVYSNLREPLCLQLGRELFVVGLKGSSLRIESPPLLILKNKLFETPCGAGGCEARSLPSPPYTHTKGHRLWGIFNFKALCHLGGVLQCCSCCWLIHRHFYQQDKGIGTTRGE